MARAIDADRLKQAIDHDYYEHYTKYHDSDQTALIDMVMDDIDEMPTLTPPNEWVNRVRELDELYTKLQIVTGFTAEQLLEIFAAGYTLEKPDYSKKFAEMENLAEAAQPNEPLTLEELREMDGEPVYLIVDDQYEPLKMWALIEVVETANCVILTSNLGGRNEYYDNDEMKDDGVTAYRRPPEGEA